MRPQRISNAPPRRGHALLPPPGRRRQREVAIFTRQEAEHEVATARQEAEREVATARQAAERGMATVRQEAEREVATARQEAEREVATAGAKAARATAEIRRVVEIRDRVVAETHQVAEAASQDAAQARAAQTEAEARLAAILIPPRGGAYRICTPYWRTNPDCGDLSGAARSLSGGQSLYSCMPG